MRCRPHGVLLALVLSAGCGPSAADLARQAKSTDARERLHAVNQLEHHTDQPATAVPALTEALRDENTYVRRDAAKVLGHFGADAKRAVPALVEMLHDKEPSVRKSAAETLKKIDPEALAKSTARK
jgi:hypothetical protein